MIKLGYKLMSEEHGPTELVRNANLAEKAGFDFAAISDHFFPWIKEQGHSPFAWSVLGALANSTRKIGLMGPLPVRSCATIRRSLPRVPRQSGFSAITGSPLGLGRRESG